MVLFLDSVETWMRLREGTKGGMETELAKVEQLLLNRGALSLEKSLCISLLHAQKVMTSWSRPRELFALNRPSDNDTTPSTPMSETKGEKNHIQISWIGVGISVVKAGQKNERCSD